MKSEPWSLKVTRRFGTWVACGDEAVALVSSRALRKGNGRVNAERIVTCVNACNGMDDPARHISLMRNRIEQLERIIRDAGGHC